MRKELNVVRGTAHEAFRFFIVRFHLANKYMPLMQLEFFSPSSTESQTLETTCYQYPTRMGIVWVEFSLNGTAASHKMNCDCIIIIEV